MVKTNMYTSEREFVIHSGGAGHNRLVLRSYKTERKPYNIDILFAGTVYVQLGFKLEGLTIRKLTDRNLVDYPSVKEYLKSPRNHLFAVDSGKERYLIAATFVKVLKNSFEYAESILTVSDAEQGELLALSSNND
jgi:hypothetical protein